MTLSSLIMKEKIARMGELKNHPERILKGFVRIVSEKNGKNGLKTSGFFIAEDAFLDLLEAIELSAPAFWRKLEKSRRSGTVSSLEIEKRLGFK